MFQFSSEDESHLTQKHPLQSHVFTIDLYFENFQDMYFGNNFDEFVDN